VVVVVMVVVLCACVCVWIGVFWRVTLDRHVICGMHFCVVLHKHKVASVISVHYYIIKLQVGQP